MAIGKKLRFEVFKRDLFVCQYCGKTPPGAVLEIDHIHPKSKNGQDVIDNLITACFDCNRGKSDNLLTTLTPSLAVKSERIKEAREQYDEYQKILFEIAEKEKHEIQLVSDWYTHFYPGLETSQRFNYNSLRYFIKKLGVNEVVESMQFACSKIYDPTDTLRYFCGICHNKIRSL